MNTVKSVTLAVCVLLNLLLAAHAWAGGVAVKHPVFPPAANPSVPGLKQAVSKAMAMSDAELAALNPDETDFYSIGCPNCTGGSQQNQLTWSIEDPDRVKCRYCGMVFPNEKYPTDKVEEVVNPLGVTQRYAYHLGPNGFKYFFRCKALNGRRQWLTSTAWRLALLYHATKEPASAHKAAVILNRWADVYPSLCVHGPADYGMRQPTFYKVQLVPPPPDGLQPVPEIFGYDAFRKVKTPYPYLSMRCGLGEWHYGEIPTTLITAYDLIYPSGELEKLSAATGKDVKRNIEDFFRATANYVRTYPRYLGNMDPSLIHGLSMVGQCIGEPEFVHDALIRGRLILTQQMFADGMWREGTVSYHRQTFSGLRSSLETMKGYTDPPGYVGREDKRHLENMDFEKEVPWLGRGDAAIQKLVFPSGEYAAIHDTWTGKTLGRKDIGTKPLSESHAGLLWAYGHAVLGRGKGDTQIQAHLHFSGSYGHDHADALNLILFAKGREMLADIGYTHTVLRPYASGSASHNLTLIDACDRNLAGSQAGSAVVFDAPSGAVQYVEARLGDQQRRSLVLVAVSDTDAYVLDVSRVQGGKRHDWFLHGSADDPQELTSDLKLAPLPDTLLGPGERFEEWTTESGSKPVPGRNNSYGLIRDLRSAKTGDTWSATFAYTDAPRKQLRVTMLGQPGAEVILGRSPAIRPAGENNAEIYKHWRPVIVVRRQGDGLKSAFTAVHEPFEGKPFLQSVRRLEIARGDGEAVGVRVESAAGVDYHLLNTSSDARCEATGESPLRLAGRYGFVRTRAGKVTAAYLLDGTELSFGDFKLSAPPPPKGKVEAVRSREKGASEDALVVSSECAASADQLSRRVLVEFGDGSARALLMTGLRNEGGKTVVTLGHDPGFEIAPDGMTARDTYFPHREIAGEVKFRIPNSIYHE